MSDQPQDNSQLIQEIMEAIRPVFEKHPEEFMALTKMSPAELLITAQSALTGAARPVNTNEEPPRS